MTSLVVGTNPYAGPIKVDAEAFEDCIALQNLKIQDGICEIGQCAFHNCSRLISVYIPGSVSCVGTGAFQGCTSMKDFVVGDGTEVLSP